MLIDYDSLFVFVDDFCTGFEPWYVHQLIIQMVQSGVAVLASLNCLKY